MLYPHRASQQLLPGVIIPIVIAAGSVGIASLVASQYARYLMTVDDKQVAQFVQSSLQVLCFPHNEVSRTA